ncbi:uncharacterized protein LOC120000581 [Tripterygium wilfordii]|uniref:uncharacterized protein LOC120000581 n=1 Tax=Tripterygium wilfordii TaxID=458696 RepID=UPI0018F84040|nr:uncharacterized protein LOC120000581 [Tripterygium wilfordii]
MTMMFGGPGFVQIKGSNSWAAGLLCLVVAVVFTTGLRLILLTSKEAKAAEKKAPPPKPKPAAKAPAKPLPWMMEEDIIPALRAIFEVQDNISESELSFQENRLDGSFLKHGNSYSFLAFFPGSQRVFPILQSNSSGASTVEPFLIDEKKTTSQHVVFWVEKRLAAQGIIPVCKE